MPDLRQDWSREVAGAMVGQMPWAHGDLGLKIRHRADQAPYLEVRTGSSWHHARGKMVHRHQVVNRDCGKYYKRVVDHDSGEVIRYTSHPLSDHVGHGADTKTWKKEGT